VLSDEDRLPYRQKETDDRERFQQEMAEAESERVTEQQRERRISLKVREEVEATQSRPARDKGPKKSSERSVASSLVLCYFVFCVIKRYQFAHNQPLLRLSHLFITV
jgi:hypothetical protein